MQQRRLIRARGSRGVSPGARRRVLRRHAARRAPPARPGADARRGRVAAPVDRVEPAGRERAGPSCCPSSSRATSAISGLHQALPPGRPLLSRTAREVLLERAARATAARPRLGGAPFQLRVGLVASMLDFYDELQRRQRRVRRFGQALFEQLRVERGMDRGSEGLDSSDRVPGLHLPRLPAPARRGRGPR